MTLELRDIKKKRGDFSLEIGRLAVKAGETLVLAGMSGCGKSTVLLIIAGLLGPDGGTVFLGGKNMDGVPPWKRGVSLVFQDLALFPHLDTGGNIAYSAKIRRLPRAERERITREGLETVRLSGYGKRGISTLSGGERQRVAIARALAAAPGVLLLDEPFSSLDAPLRKSLRLEFREILKKLNIPCIFVTHDREEAAVLGDRIAFMRGGRIVEEGTARDIFLFPETRAGAEFFGAGTVLPCSLLVPEDALSLERTEGSLPLPARLVSAVFGGASTAIALEVAVPGRAQTVILRGSRPSRLPLPPEGGSVTVWLRGDLLRRVEEN